MNSHFKKVLTNNYVSFIGTYRPIQTWNSALKKITPYSRVLIYNPTHLVFRITTKCNMKCNFCIWKDPDFSPEFFNFDDMPLKRFVEIVERFGRAIAVELSGGEALLHKDFFKMVRYAHSKKMYVNMSTNGVLLRDKMAQIIKAPLSAINISLDAVNPNDYEEMHGCSNIFYDILQNITDLVANRKKHNTKLQLWVSYVCTKRNYKKIPEMVHLAEDLGVDRLFVHNLVHYNLPGFSTDQLLYSDDSDVREVIDSVDRSRFNLLVRMPALISRQNTQRLCRLPFRMLTVQGDGRYNVCCEMTKKDNFGGMINDGEIWNGSSFQRIRRILTDNSAPLPERCRFCRNMSRPYKILNAY